jgi:hypothetical protein
VLAEGARQQVQQIKADGYLVVIVYRLQLGAARLQHAPHIKLETMPSRYSVQSQAVRSDIGADA